MRTTQSAIAFSRSRIGFSEKNFCFTTANLHLGHRQIEDSVSLLETALVLKDVRDMPTRRGTSGCFLRPASCFRHFRHADASLVQKDAFIRDCSLFRDP